MGFARQSQTLSRRRLSDTDLSTVAEALRVISKSFSPGKVMKTITGKSRCLSPYG